MKTEKKCPSWAEELIEYLRQAEVYRGTIPNNPNWKDESVKKLLSRLTGEELPVFDNHKIDYLFDKIVLKLKQAKYSPEDIVAFINERIRLKESKIAYCSLEEVKESLERKTKKLEC